MAYPPEDPKLAHLMPSLSPTGPSTLGSKLRAQGGGNVRNQYYKNVKIELNGYSFTNCCFEGCHLYTNTGLFAFNACRIVGCALFFGDPALRVLKAFHTFYGLSQFAVFNPNFSPDGLVTIG